MKTLPKVDAVIIGGGWTGLLMAKELGARTPLSVVVLERGAPRNKDDYAGGMDELDYNVRFRMMQDYSLRDRDAALHARTTAPFPSANSVRSCPGQGTGGAGEHWGAVFPRFRAGRFRAAHEHHARDTARKSCPKITPSWIGALPGMRSSPTTLAPTSSSALPARPAIIRGKIIEGGNIFEGPRSEEYPTPPTKTPYYGSLFARRGEIARLSSRIPIRPPRSALPTRIPTASRGPAASTADSATASAA